MVGGSSGGGRRRWQAAVAGSGRGKRQLRGGGGGTCQPRLCTTTTEPPGTRRSPAASHSCRPTCPPAYQRPAPLTPLTHLCLAGEGVLWRAVGRVQDQRRPAPAWEVVASPPSQAGGQTGRWAGSAGCMAVITKTERGPKHGDAAWDAGGWHQGQPNSSSSAACAAHPPSPSPPTRHPPPDERQNRLLLHLWDEAAVTCRCAHRAHAPHLPPNKGW